MEKRENRDSQRERERERERERDMGREETRVSDSEGVRREKVREEGKSEKTYHKRKKASKNYVSHNYRR